MSSVPSRWWCSWKLLPFGISRTRSAAAGKPFLFWLRFYLTRFVLLKDSGCYTKMKVFSGASLIYEHLIRLYISVEENIVFLRSEKSVSASLIQLQRNNYFNNLACMYYCTVMEFLWVDGKGNEPCMYTDCAKKAGDQLSLKHPERTQRCILQCHPISILLNSYCMASKPHSRPRRYLQAVQDRRGELLCARSNLWCQWSPDCWAIR